jgi:hypothetical protein
MQATLYIPNQPPQLVSTAGLSLPLPTGYTSVSDEVVQLLGCPRALVDVLDSGPDYVAFSIFDYEGETNHLAMSALESISGHKYDARDEDQILQGPILVVTAL